MKTPGSLALASMLVLGCAGGDGPGSGTDFAPTGASASSPTAATFGDDSSSTTSTSTSSTPTTDPTRDDTTTDEPASSSSEGSSSSGTASSTGECPAGTLGCPCDPASDPECDEGLLCNADDVCEGAACRDKADEPNDDPNEPEMLTGLAEGDDPITESSQLSEDTDIDWFQWTCEEPFFGLTTPDLEFSGPQSARACLFLDCNVGGNPLFECPGGTVSTSAPIDNLPGCCITGTGSFTIDEPNCPDSSDDTIETYLRVDGGEEGICAPYTFTYGC